MKMKMRTKMIKLKIRIKMRTKVIKLKMRIKRMKMMTTMKTLVPIGSLNMMPQARSSPFYGLSHHLPHHHMSIPSLGSTSYQIDFPLNIPRSLI